MRCRKMKKGKGWIMLESRAGGEGWEAFLFYAGWTISHLTSLGGDWEKVFTVV